MNLALTSKIMTIQQIELDKSWEILRPKQDWIFVVEFLKKLGGLSRWRGGAAKPQSDICLQNTFNIDISSSELTWPPCRNIIWFDLMHVYMTVYAYLFSSTLFNQVNNCLKMIITVKNIR